MSTQHVCHCPDCGAAHSRQAPPLARYCFECLDWLPDNSRAKYCSDDCRSKARQKRAARRSVSGPTAAAENASIRPS